MRFSQVTPCDFGFQHALAVSAGRGRFRRRLGLVWLAIRQRPTKMRPLVAAGRKKLRDWVNRREYLSAPKARKSGPTKARLTGYLRREAA